MATRHDQVEDPERDETPTRAERLRADAANRSDSTTSDKSVADTTATDTGKTATAATAATAAGTASKSATDTERTTRNTTRSGVPSREDRLAAEAAEQRRQSAYELAKARGTNRWSTDFGLLLLRVLPVIMFLHGLKKAQGYSGFRETVANNSFGALAPDVFALMVVAGQLALPILIALGFLTRFAGLLLAVMMGFVWVLTQLPNGIIDARTGGLVGEAALMYIAVSLPLVFTGAGRFSIDHALFGKRADARAHRKADRVTT